MHQAWMTASLLLGVVVLAFAQQPLSEPAAEAARLKKEAQYLRLENDFCRARLLDVWSQGEVAENRVKELEAAVKQLSEDLLKARQPAAQVVPEKQP